MKFNLKEIKSDISSKKNIYILGAIGILLLLFSSMGTKENKEVLTEDLPVDYCRELEEKLEDILPKITNVGKTDVMITAKNYGRVTLAKDSGNSGEQTVILSQKGGGQETQIVSEAYPEIQGIIIVAEGGANVKVKESLTEAVMALLNVDAHKIKVFERTIN
ncbi:MAG: hypothetical protein ACI3XA_05455 [Clostridia bacterium]